jgi:cytoskeleton protein RodZ
VVDPSREAADEDEGDADVPGPLVLDDDEGAEASGVIREEAHEVADGAAAAAPRAPDPDEAEEGAGVESEPESVPELDDDRAGITAPSAGTRLREAREARGLSIDDLARTLNLHPRVVDALERDDDAALPAVPFVRGYLRAYARLMSMDPAPLLEDHERRTGGVVVTVVPSPRIEEPAASPGILHERPGTVMAVATLGFVVVVGAVLLLRPEVARLPAVAEAPSALETVPGATSRAARGASAPSSTATVAAAEEPLGTPSDAPPGGGVAAAAPVAGDPRPEPAPRTDTGFPVPQVAESPGANADGGILRTRTADGRGLRVYAGGEDHLHFDFTED